MNKYEHTAEQIEEFDDEQKKFILWILLQDYGEATENGAKMLNDPKSVEEFAVYRMMMNHAKIAKEIAEVISFEIF